MRKEKRYTVDQLRKMGEIPYPERETKSSRKLAIRNRLELLEKSRQQLESKQTEQPQQAEPPKRDKKKRKDMGWAI